MFFTLSKTITKLIYPLPLLFILALVTYKFRKKAWAKKVGIGLFIALYFFSLEGPSVFLMNKLEYPQVKKAQLKPKYDVAIVLTGMIDLAHSTQERLEFGSSIDRIFAGIDMVKSGRAEKLLITGGTGNLFDQKIKEAPFLKSLSMELGVPESKIIIESDSRNTRENALFTSKLVQEHGFENLLLITSSSHMRRSLGCFRKVELDPDPYPVDFNNQARSWSFNPIPTEYALTRNRHFLKEIIGITAYWVAGYL